MLADRNSNGLSLRERLGHLVICFPFLFNAIPEDVITYSFFLPFIKKFRYPKSYKLSFYYFLGAHAVGRCHTDRSGFWGPWTHAESTLSNEYYRLMFEEKWTPKKTHNGQEWKGPPQFENKDGDLMMLSTG